MPIFTYLSYILDGSFYSWRKPEYPEKIAVIVTLYHITNTPHYVLICELANFCDAKHASERERERKRERERERERDV